MIRYRIPEVREPEIEAPNSPEILTPTDPQSPDRRVEPREEPKPGDPRR